MPSADMRKQGPVRPARQGRFGFMQSGAIKFDNAPDRDAGVMAQVLIRNLDEDTVESYRQKAKFKGISLEQELRDLLESNKPFSAEERLAVSRRLRERFAVEEFDSKAAIREGRDDEFEELELRFDQR